MPAYVYLAAMCIVGSLILLTVSLNAGRAPMRRVRANLGAPEPEVTDLREVVLAQPAHERVVRPAIAGLARGARRVTPRGVLEGLDRKIQLAGLTDEWPVERVLAAKLVLGAVGASAGLAMVLTNPSPTAFVLLAAGAFIGFVLPDVFVTRRARERQETIQRELPDVLDQVTICVEAGLGFEAALSRAAGGQGPLADELSRTLQDIRFGMPRRVALDKLLDRTDVADLRHFVVAIGNADRHGIPIAQVLRIQSTELRQKRRQRAEESALKIPVKLVFPLILCIMPALFIVLVGPAGIRIANSSFGS
jgi:tight adherence protein C